MAGLTRDEVRPIAANIANGRSCFAVELHHALPLDLAANFHSSARRAHEHACLLKIKARKNIFVEIGFLTCDER